MSSENIPRVARGEDYDRAREFFDRELKDRLMVEHERCAVLIDARSLDYVIQSMSETRLSAQNRLLERRPDAELYLDYLVGDDFAYSAPSGFVIDS